MPEDFFLLNIKYHQFFFQKEMMFPIFVRLKNIYIL